MEPLAYRMKPTKLDDFFGQEEIVGKDKLLYRLIKADKLSSAIFWGPPGCGKTSLAKVVAKTTKHTFKELNATTAGVGDIKNIIESTKNIFTNPTGKTIVFIDEIHRFNKLQQDALLPAVEKGDIILIGATTESPYFEVNKALVSRSTIFKFSKLTKDDIIKIQKKAIEDKENGLGEYNIKVSNDVLEQIALYSNGDVRTALNTLELAVVTSEMDKQGKINITKDIVKNCLNQKKSSYDKNSEAHYNTISAFIKSMRGSDVDATIHYLARMLEAGEDPLFIARRIVICASEDVGLANNEALLVAVSAMQAVHQIGMPEARIILSHAAIVVAKSRKSNSAYIAINKAIEDAKNIDIGEIPEYLKNTDMSKVEGNTNTLVYKYPHDYENGIVNQQYLPNEIKDKKYYIPKKWEK